ncbi:mannitol-1-phosphate 5-dehydrogenase [Paenibacillus nanensis]|uniref:Mannitol-1-phosphate 5-dehydrogenase n=1 Tax=Paenibacillus nanensis TaxID=393251 RepID=A0A3A1UVM8_9BACL|nr:mannitol-1-phosphate 5-dehydrogenase [Paenibacillus nanensis]RIX51491.1 mannitol-1-phosphate 5-dehydrogenase [Paenibacillus nanensis]
MIAVHFGAGNIGLGFIGLLLSQSGYEVKFVDVNEERVNLINERKSFKVALASEAGETTEVQGVSAINGRDADKVIDAIAEADIVTTAVGVGALPYLAGNIAEGIKRRLAAGQKPLVVIACENAIGGSTILKGHVLEKLDPGLREQAERAAAFPDAAVDRIVPLQQNEDPLQVTVEPFYEWVVDRSALPADFPHLQGVHFVDRLEPYIERKLFTVNTGHCCAAYFGYLKGHDTIQLAMQDEAVVAIVRKALEETGKTIVRVHGFDPEEHKRYIEKILERFRNPYLIDEVSRVGRSPIRKISPSDRLVRPMTLAYELDIETPALTMAVAAALFFDSKDDPEAAELQQAIREQGVSATIAKYTGLQTDHPLHAAIVKEYDRIRQEQEGK